MDEEQPDMSVVLVGGAKSREDVVRVAQIVVVGNTAAVGRTIARIYEALRRMRWARVVAGVATATMLLSGCFHSQPNMTHGPFTVAFEDGAIRIAVCDDVEVESIQMATSDSRGPGSDETQWWNVSSDEAVLLPAGTILTTETVWQLFGKHDGVTEPERLPEAGVFIQLVAPDGSRERAWMFFPGGEVPADGWVNSWGQIQSDPCPAEPHVSGSP